MSDDPQGNPYAHPYSGGSPRPALDPAQERTWATATHIVTGIATVLSAGTLGFVAALVVYVLYKDRGPFVRHYAATAMNIQLTALLWCVVIAVGGLLTFGVGWILFAAIPVVMVVLHVLAAIKADRGEWYDPPMTIRFIS